MYKGKRIIAIIPARGGSKGLPKKNILPIAGKPLIAWTIEEAKKSKYLDDIIVSTDDVRIVEVAKDYSSWAPFLRPADLSSDTASSIDVVRHALDFSQKEKQLKYDVVVLLEPTSPLREVIDIDRAVELFLNHDAAESLVSLCELEAFHPAFLYSVSDAGYISSFEKNTNGHIRRQDLKKIYYPEGTIYISYQDSLLKRKTFYHEKTISYIVPKWKSIEIDELSDLLAAEAILNFRTSGGNF